MKYFDAFSGYGGFHLGIERVIDAECIGYSEIDKYASAVYKHHFGGKDESDKNRQQEPIGERTIGNDLQRQGDIWDSNVRGRKSESQEGHRILNGLHNEGVKNYGDITKIDPTTIPDFDLFVGGFPCQAFSIAGKRGGFNDTRGTLFFEIIRILASKKPRLVLLENVKGLLSHDSGRTFKTIISSLAELGYSVEWQVLNAKNFGVPQNRERVFIIGHLGGFGGRQVFPIRSDEQENTNQCHPTVDANYHKGQSNQRRLIYEGAIMSEKNKEWINDGKQHSRNFPQGQRVYSAKGISSTISSQAGGLGGKTGLYSITDEQIVEKNIRIRRLTPTECERLMGLPDGWTKYGNFDGEIKEISDTQRYKLCGNGVVVNVVEEIIKRLETYERI